MNLITLKHAINRINKGEIEILNNRYSLNIDCRKKKQIIAQQLIEKYNNGLLTKEILDEMKEYAFGNKLDYLDGFMLSYDNVLFSFDLEELIKKIDEFNSDEDLELEKSFNFKVTEINSDEGYIKILGELKKIDYHHIQAEGESEELIDKRQAYFEIYSDKGIVFINSNNYNFSRSMCVGINKFLKYLFGNDDVKLRKPRIATNIEFSEDKIKEKSPEICLITLKMLDILFEFENVAYNFRKFEVVKFEFDHEENLQFEKSSRIKQVTYCGENLEVHNKMKELIINGREILSYAIIIEYLVKDVRTGEVKITQINAQVKNDKGHFRLTINENNSDIQVNNQIDMLKAAYKDLKSLFINNCSSKTLKNEDKILKLMGEEQDEEEEIFAI